MQQSHLRCDGTVSKAPRRETVDHHHREVVLSQRHTDGCLESCLEASVEVLRLQPVDLALQSPRLGSHPLSFPAL